MAEIYIFCFIGKIPLRQLVYRVIELPPSMRPLVYDFGQIKDKTAENYIKQIVQNRCQEIAIIKGKNTVADQIAKILIRCHKYMRDKKVIKSAIIYIIASIG